ncbi:MAG: metal ABC transporter ATP-binding protein [Gemmataceae bacterium]|nr:metal ABC transporter ATP-binding protein [Gemmataceae bacterium]
MSEPFAVLRDVRVSLGGVEILRGVEAELRRAEVTALIGMNGAGKTTLVRALLGEVPFTGEIRFACRHAPNAPGHVGYVPQKLRLDAGLPLTVLDLFGLSLRSSPWFLGAGRAFRAEVAGHLDGVGAAPLIDQQVRTLSGGQLQRVLLALALQPTPELLLLDEPAAGIDFRMQEEFYKLIARLNRDLGATVLLVSHDLSMVPKVAGRVWCMRDGRIVSEGAPRDVLGGEAMAEVFGQEVGLHLHRHGE